MKRRGGGVVMKCRLHGGFYSDGEGSVWDLIPGEPTSGKRGWKVRVKLNVLVELVSADPNVYRYYGLNMLRNELNGLDRNGGADIYRYSVAKPLF